MLFFKYRQPTDFSFNMLRRGEIHFSSQDELNDASECRPRFVFKGSDELWQRLAHHIIASALIYRNNTYEVSAELLEIGLGHSNEIGVALRKSSWRQDFKLENLEDTFIKVTGGILGGKIKNNEKALIIHLLRKYISNDLHAELKEDIYISAFSKSAASTAMWGHYADAERGYVIIYETLDLTFKVISPIMLPGVRPIKGETKSYTFGSYKDHELELKQMHYQNRPPTVNAFHRLINKFSYSEEEDHYDVPLLIEGDAASKKEEMVGLIKSLDWRYEKELRAFYPANGFIPKDARTLQVHPSSIKGIIWGPKMTKENKRRTMFCCHMLAESNKEKSGKEIEFQFFQARQSIDKFDFEIQPVGVLDKDFAAYRMSQSSLKPMQKLDSNASERIHQTLSEIRSNGKSFNNRPKADAVPEDTRRKAKSP